MGKKIYLGIPYTHEDVRILDYRCKLADRIAAVLMNNGNYVYSPISHTHPIAKLGKLPCDWAYWKGYCECFFDGWTDELHVITAHGWDTSTGVEAEINLANDKGIPVKYIEPTTFSYPEETAWTGFFDSTHAMIFYGDTITVETDTNVHKHGAWAAYKVTREAPGGEEDSGPVLQYEFSEKGQVVPKSTFVWPLSLCYEHNEPHYEVKVIA